MKHKYEVIVPPITGPSFMMGHIGDPRTIIVEADDMTITKPGILTFWEDSRGSEDNIIQVFASGHWYSVRRLPKGQ